VHQVTPQQAPASADGKTAESIASPSLLMAAFIRPPCEMPAGVTGANASSLRRPPWRAGGAKVAANRHPYTWPCADGYGRLSAMPKEATCRAQFTPGGRLLADGDPR